MTASTTLDRAAELADKLGAAAAGALGRPVAGPAEPVAGPEPGAAGYRLAVGTIGHLTILGIEGDELRDAFVSAANPALAEAFGESAGRAEPADEPGDTFAAGSAGFRIALDGEQAAVAVVFDPALLQALDPGEPQPTVAPAALPDLGRGARPNGDHDLSVLSDVAMNVTVELGRARLKVRELLGLSEGSVIELDRAAGAAVDVLVNGTVVARGDVVVIDDDLGVRITEVVERA